MEWLLTWFVSNWAYFIVGIPATLLVLTEIHWTRDIDKAFNPKPEAVVSLIDGKPYHEILCDWDDRFYKLTGTRPDPPLASWLPLNDLSTAQVYARLTAMEVYDGVGAAQHRESQLLHKMDEEVWSPALGRFVTRGQWRTAAELWKEYHAPVTLQPHSQDDFERWLRVPGNPEKVGFSPSVSAASYGQGRRGFLVP